MNQKLRFRKKQMDTLFPATYTKLRPEDFGNLAHQHRDILNQRECNNLINFRKKLNYGKNKDSYFEFYAVKKNNHIELVPFDDTEND